MRTPECRLRSNSSLGRFTEASLTPGESACFASVNELVSLPDFSPSLNTPGRSITPPQHRPSATSTQRERNDLSSLQVRKTSSFTGFPPTHRRLESAPIDSDTNPIQRDFTRQASVFSAGAIFSTSPLNTAGRAKTQRSPHVLSYRKSASRQITAPNTKRNRSVETSYSVPTVETYASRRVVPALPHFPLDDSFASRNHFEPQQIVSRRETLGRVIEEIPPGESQSLAPASSRHEALTLADIPPLAKSPLLQSASHPAPPCNNYILEPTAADPPRNTSQTVSFSRPPAAASGEGVNRKTTAQAKMKPSLVARAFNRRWLSEATSAASTAPPPPPPPRRRKQNPARRSVPPGTRRPNSLALMGYQGGTQPYPQMGMTMGMGMTALSPVASRSLLTCNQDFRSCYPNVYQGICKGIIDIERLIAHEVVIPIKEEINLHKNAIRSRRAVTSIISEQLWRPLHGRFPDPQIAPRLVKRLADYFYDKIEGGIGEAEDERSVMQWMLRFDVENGMDIKVTTTLAYGVNSAIANIEGVAHVKRKKGEMLGLWSKDSIVVDLEIVVKALFLNGGQLSELNGDSMFIDHVATGENRFATQFIVGGM